MLRTRTRIATALDRLAMALYKAGERLAGDRGGWVADRLAMALIAPLANLTGVPCTCGGEHG